MGNIKLIADSTCDLSQELIEKYDISIIPLCIIMDDKSYYDGMEATPEQIFEWSEENNTTPKTAAASFDMATEVLKPYMDEGYDIIFIGISQEMSTTCNVIRLVAEECEYENIHIVDSRNLSTGIGLQILKAASLIEEGKSAQEIVQILEETVGKVKSSFIVDTLKYLARGGRCNAVTALLAGTLKLHPKIVVKDGAMGVDKKYRGNIDVALKKYVEDLREELLDADPNAVFITHSGCNEKTVNLIRTYLEELGYFDNIYETRAGGVISSHCGPGTLGVLYCEK